MGSPGIIVLAAGGSTRMRSPKQLLPWKGQTLLTHAVETALKTSCRPVVVVLGCEAEACANELSSLDVVIVVNETWKLGIGSSIAAGVRVLEKGFATIPGVMILLADQPTVSAELLAQLLRAWSPLTVPITATKYTHGGGVPAIFAERYFEELKGLESDRGARAIIAREGSKVSLFDPGSDLIDLDTPAIYQKLATGAESH